MQVVKSADKTVMKMIPGKCYRYYGVIKYQNYVIDMKVLQIKRCGKDEKSLRKDKNAFRIAYSLRFVQTMHTARNHRCILPVNQHGIKEEAGIVKLF